MADSAIGLATPAVATPKAVSRADILAVAAAILGAFIATLDVSVTNSSLPQIQGEIGATGSEGSWIATGYLVAEIVMIPLAAWFVRVLGLRTFLLIAVVTFTIFSISCGMASGLTQMIICRIGQGFTGGAMIPTAMTVIRTRLPPSAQSIGFALFGATATLGPITGPPVGGWLTENMSWHYIFFLNLPVGACLIGLLLFGLKHQRAHFEEFIRADFVGIAGLVLGLGGLTVVLEEGQREQWFDSSVIVGTTILAVIGAILITISELRSRKPVLTLRLLANPRFASNFFVGIVVGGSLYSLIYILPVFLGAVQGYNAQQTGQVVLVSGIPSLLLLPTMPFLLRRIDHRLLASFGLICFATSCFLSTHLTADSGASAFLFPQLLRGAGQVLVLSPLGQSATASVAFEDIADASGLYNMARNLGGSMGLALTSTLSDIRLSFHTQQITESLTANNPLTQEYLLQGGAMGDPVSAMRPIGQLAAMIQKQALVMAYSDCFFVLGVSLLAVLPLLLLLKPPRRLWDKRG